MSPGPTSEADRISKPQDFRIETRQASTHEGGSDSGGFSDSSSRDGESRPNAADQSSLGEDNAASATPDVGSDVVDAAGGSSDEPVPGPNGPDQPGLGDSAVDSNDGDPQANAVTDEADSTGAESDSPSPDLAFSIDASTVSDALPPDSPDVPVTSGAGNDDQAPDPTDAGSQPGADQPELPGDSAIPGPGQSDADLVPAPAPGDSHDQAGSRSDSETSKDDRAPDSTQRDAPDKQEQVASDTAEPTPGPNGADQPSLRGPAENPERNGLVDDANANVDTTVEGAQTHAGEPAAQSQSPPPPGDSEKWGDADPPGSGTKNETWEEGPPATATPPSAPPPDPAPAPPPQAEPTANNTEPPASTQSPPPPGDFGTWGDPDPPGSGTKNETWEEGPPALPTPPSPAPPDPAPPAAPPPAPAPPPEPTPAPPGDSGKWGDPDPPGSGTKNETWEEGPPALPTPPSPAPPDPAPPAAPPPAPAPPPEPTPAPPGDSGKWGDPDPPGSGTKNETWEEVPSPADTSLPSAPRPGTSGSTASGTRTAPRTHPRAARRLRNGATPTHPAGTKTRPGGPPPPPQRPQTRHLRQHRLRHPHRPPNPPPRRPTRRSPTRPRQVHRSRPRRARYPGPGDGVPLTHLAPVPKTRHGRRAALPRHRQAPIQRRRPPVPLRK